MRVLTATATMLLVLASGSAHAWSRPGHMVTAAIAYSELEERPEVLERAIALLEAHPDRGSFEVAIDRTTGTDRAKRLFYQCARWPDDARGTPYDHPTWHYAARPVVRPDVPERPEDRIEGQAMEAFALNARVLGDSRAALASRAVALCWVMHLVGDIHQPLHAAQLFSREHPHGDELGSRQFVREAPTADPITLHWFWDDRVHRSGVQASVEARADALRRVAEGSSNPARAGEFPRWAEESYRAAAALAYRADLATAARDLEAPVPGAAYIAEATALSERRLALAGHRLADVLIEALGDTCKDGSTPYCKRP